MTTTRATIHLDQFTTTGPDDNHEVIYQGDPSLFLTDACKDVLGGGDADGEAVVLVVLDMNECFSRVLVQRDEDNGEDEIAAMTKAIARLTVARDQLARLQRLVESDAA